jgi:hypothetical protein
VLRFFTERSQRMRRPRQLLWEEFCLTDERHRKYHLKKKEQDGDKQINRKNEFHEKRILKFERRIIK